MDLIVRALCDDWRRIVIVDKVSGLLIRRLERLDGHRQTVLKVGKLLQIHPITPSLGLLFHLLLNFSL